MALHLEDHSLAVADVDHAGVLSWAADHLGAGGGQAAEVFLGGLVGTMFVPHGREDAELGEAGFAAHDVEDALVFVGLDPVGSDQVGRDGRVLHDMGSP